MSAIVSYIRDNDRAPRVTMETAGVQPLVTLCHGLADEGWREADTFGLRTKAHTVAADISRPRKTGPPREGLRLQINSQPTGSAAGKLLRGPACSVI